MAHGVSERMAKWKLDEVSFGLDSEALGRTEFPELNSFWLCVFLLSFNYKLWATEGISFKNLNK